MKVYVDTNIIMDYLLNRNQSSFFSETIQCKYTIFISDLVIDELQFQKILQEANQLLQWLDFCKKLTIIKISKADKKLALSFLDKTHHNDALHAACAIHANVSFLLTRNLKDFKKLPLDCKHPNEI